MRKAASLFLMLAVMLFVDCKKDGDKTGETAPGETPDKNPPASDSSGGSDLFGAFDAKAELDHLQGTWQVKDSFGGFATWVVKGDTVVRTGKDGAEEKGKLEIPYPGKVAFVQEKGGGTQRSFYGYTRTGDDIYLGLGKAGTKIGDRYMLAADGLLIKQGAGCKFYKHSMFKGFEKEGLDVKCELLEEAGKKMLSYEIPDSFKKGEMKQGKVNIVGDALLDDQMMGNKAIKK